MNLKILTIRKSSEEKDEKDVNDFLNSVYAYKPEVFPSGDSWKVFVFYKERDVAADKKNEYENKPPRIKNADKIIFEETESLTEEESELLNRLKKWRYDKSNSLGYPPYFIAHNAHLITIVKLKPKILDDFLAIKGFSSRTIALYGQEILDILHKTENEP